MATWTYEDGSSATISGISYWAGAWAVSTDYTKGQGVENDGSTYVCILAHTSSAIDEPGVGANWEIYWDLIASKGDTGDTGATGATGATGPAGADGADGSDGADGVGVPAGGTTGQSLVKNSNTDYDTTWTTVTGGGGASTKDVNQTTHGFAVGDVIRSSGTDGEYQKAQADSEANAEVAGIVTEVTDGDNFTYTLQGYISTAAAVPNETAGTVLFLDPSTAGALTATEPTTSGQISKPLGIITIANSEMIFFNMRGMENTEGTITGIDVTQKLGSQAEGGDLRTFEATDGTFDSSEYLEVFKNGVRMVEGATEDYQTSGNNQAVFVYDVLATDKITLVIRGTQNLVGTYIEKDLTTNYSEKANPVDADLIPINDSADSNNTKYIQLGNSPFKGDAGTGTSTPDAATNANKLFYKTDTDTLYVSNGTAWIALN